MHTTLEEGKRSASLFYSRLDYFIFPGIMQRENNSWTVLAYPRTETRVEPQFQGSLLTIQTSAYITRL